MQLRLRLRLRAAATAAAVSLVVGMGVHFTVTRAHSLPVIIRGGVRIKAQHVIISSSIAIITVAICYRD